MPSTWAFSSFYSVFLRLRGTNNFSLLPPQSSCCDSCSGAGCFLFLHSFFLLVRPSWKSLTDFLFTGSPQAVDLSYLVLFMISAFLAAFHSCHFSQIARIFCCWFESSLPVAFTFFLFFSSLVPCDIAPLSMNVCSILFWSLTASLNAGDPVFLFNRWDLIWAMLCVWTLAFSGIPTRFPLGFFSLAY